MCHRILQEHAEPRRAAGARPVEPPGLRRPRSRWIGAGAAALVAGLAAAAVIAPTPHARIVEAEAVPVAALPVAPEPVSMNLTVPSTGVIEQTATTMDDGVPSAPATTTARSELGHCEHGL